MNPALQAALAFAPVVVGAAVVYEVAIGKEGRRTRRTRRKAKAYRRRTRRKGRRR